MLVWKKNKNFRGGILLLFKLFEPRDAYIKNSHKKNSVNFTIYSDQLFCREPVSAAFETSVS